LSAGKREPKIHIQLPHIVSCFSGGSLRSFLIEITEESVGLNKWESGKDTEEDRDLRETSIQIMVDCIPACSSTSQ